MYGTLRAELRQRNVETLERMLNQTFDLVSRTTRTRTSNSTGSIS